MIDASQDQEFAAFEREQDRREAKEAYVEYKKRQVQGSLLARSQPKVAQDVGTLQQAETTATVVVPAAKEKHGEEVAYSYLRTARISTACALVLLIFLIWLWSQRRNS